MRFAFWGSEEVSLEGSTNYVRGLARDQLNDIALYLNFDMLGSPNAGFFTYDGDQSGQPNPSIPPSEVPAGSAGIERTLAGYLNLAGIRPADMPLARTTDYSAFLAAGVPIGGATTGAAKRKPRCRRGFGADGPVSPSTRTTTPPATGSTTSTGMRCRSWDPRSRSRSAHMRSRPRAPTASRPATKTDFQR